MPPEPAAPAAVAAAPIRKAIAAHCLTVFGAVFGLNGAKVVVVGPVGRVMGGKCRVVVVCALVVVVCGLVVEVGWIAVVVGPGVEVVVLDPPHSGVGPGIWNGSLRRNTKTCGGDGVVTPEPVDGTERDGPGTAEAVHADSGTASDGDQELDAAVALSPTGTDQCGAIDLEGDRGPGLEAADIGGS